MTVTTDAVDTAAVAKSKQDPVVSAGVDDDLIGQLVQQARTSGLQLTGEGGLLQQLTKRVLEAALDGELTDHIGYDKHDPAGKNGGNSRNGARAKNVLTDIGPVEISVPRDRDGSFEPQIVRKRQRRLTGVEDMVLSLSAKGLTTRGDQRPPGRGVRGRGVQADDLHDHRQGDGRHGRVAEPAPGPRLSGRVPRRHQRQDPRREGREPADLRRFGRHRRWHPRHPRPVGRRRW